MFFLDLQSKDPIYEQLKQQILRFIEAGVLSPGEKLPSVRQLAQENGINPNTVAKAYRELEEDGVLYNMPKKGVYVASIESSDRQKFRAEAVLRPLKEAGVSREEILRALDEIYGEE